MAETGGEPVPDALETGGQVSPYSPNAIHLLRTVQRNTLVLAQMADQKASILMGASFLVFSIAVSRTLVGHLPVSLGILALFSFLSALCGAIAVMPSVGSPAKAGKRNMLFFGHYHDRTEDQWADELLPLMQSDDGVFRLMLRDIHQNGMVLYRRKYRYLGYAYRLFVVGLVTTLIAFAIEMAAYY